MLPCLKLSQVEISLINGHHFSWASSHAFLEGLRAVGSLSETGCPRGFRFRLGGEGGHLEACVDGGLSDRGRTLGHGRDFLGDRRLSEVT